MADRETGYRECAECEDRRYVETNAQVPDDPEPCAVCNTAEFDAWVDRHPEAGYRGEIGLTLGSAVMMDELASKLYIRALDRQMGMGGGGTIPVTPSAYVVSLIADYAVNAASALVSRLNNYDLGTGKLKSLQPPPETSTE